MNTEKDILFVREDVKVEVLRAKHVLPPPHAVVIRLTWEHAKALRDWAGDKDSGPNDVNYAFWDALNSAIDRAKAA